MGALEGLISQDVFKFITGLFFGLSILAATARTAIRFHLYRKFQADDFLLFFAVACSIAGVGLLYALVPIIYLSASIKSEGLATGKLLDLIAKADWFRARYHAYFALSWTAIFAVKFAFLAFFQRLVQRLGWIHTYWRITVGVTAVSWVYCLVNGFIACRKTGIAAAACAHGSLLVTSTALAAVATALDIVTEIMIVVIPIWIVTEYRRSPRQKIGMGIFLCLNGFQGIVAIVRIAGIKSRFGLDHTWNDFWTQLEVSVAISMISLTAFRSFFIAERSRHRRRRYRDQRYYYSTPMKPVTGSSSQPEQSGTAKENPLPPIPSATMTGLRTFIRNDGLESRLDVDLMRPGDIDTLACRKPEPVIKAWDHGHGDSTHLIT